jgi:selenide,water dikinase
VTGASGRNWESYGNEVSLPDAFSEADKALLSDPQTSGGLLVSCSPDLANQVLEIFHTQGFADAAVIGEVAQGSGVSVY